MKSWIIILIGVMMIALAGACLFHERVEIGLNLARQRFAKRTIDDRLQEFGGAARGRWSPYFETNGVAFPPKKVVFLVLKAERVFEVYGDDGAGLHFIRRL